MHTYDIRLTIETGSIQPIYALTRVKKALQNYSGSGTITVIKATAERSPVFVGMGSLFRKEGNLYGIVSTGLGGKCTYVLTRFKGGCWSTSGSLKEIVGVMTCRSEDWTLVATGERPHNGEPWTGKVALEEVAL